MKQGLEEAKAWKDSPWKNWLAPHIGYRGPEHKRVGLTELGWASCIFVARGERLVWGLPLSTLVMMLCKAKNLKNSDGIESITEVANFMVSLDRDAVVGHNGFVFHAKAGAGVVVPPLYVIAHASMGLLSDEPAEDLDEDAVANLCSDCIDARPRV